jgi:hypothetical protein
MINIQEVKGNRKEVGFLGDVIGEGAGQMVINFMVKLPGKIG